MSAEGAFTQAVDAEVRAIYQDLLDFGLRDSELFRQAWTPPEPIYGPPSPQWFELRLDAILARHALSGAGILRRELLDLLDEADELGRDW